MTLVVSIAGAGATTLADVGGKGRSLIRMTAAGLPVPPGFVVTARFFAPWFEEILASAAWAAVTRAAPDAWAGLCPVVQGFCADLRTTPVQRAALDDLRRALAGDGTGGWLAVRSSSPEEDLASASFAGGYETRLGVRPDDLEDAVRRCFASSLDARVLVYKRAHGLDVREPRIAVVVQRQIDGEIAGVGFSLNPLTNDYDEAVIDASWGLGAPVVGGTVSPDRFVVDKVERRVLSRALGAKETSTWLGARGGTVERARHRSDELTLDDARVLEIADRLGQVETLHGEPVDVEWAYEGDRLHLLQARPVTTHVPLPPEMVTAPGARRRLYTDLALSSGLTTTAPISPLGSDTMRRGVVSMVDRFLGPLRLDLTFEEGLWFFAGGRMYMNLSNVLWLVSSRTLAKGSRTSDALMAEVLAGVDDDRYRSARRPPWARLRMLRYAPRFAWRMRRFAWGALRAMLFPERAHRIYRRRVDEYPAALAAVADEDLPPDEYRSVCAACAERHLFDVAMPALAAAMLAMKGIDLVAGRRNEERRALGARMKLGFPGNVVVEMGIAMFRLARGLDRSDFDDGPGLEERVRQRRMPPEFLAAWDGFLARFGCRGPLEMDLARPRYADDPGLALRQMASLAAGADDFDPETAHRRRVEERRGAAEALGRQSGPLRRALLRRVHRMIELFAGVRDTPKHHNLMFMHAVRRRGLIEGARLVAAGRLDAATDVFDLTFEDLAAAARDPALDLRAIGAERSSFSRRLEARVAEFPGVIDSRGRILRPPPRAARPGELIGVAVSSGVVTGRVKRLRDPGEKRIEPGDVLVAYTTDPGWTPLFASAAAVVLEVGGILQHGAVVAREYGKPCVAGIDRVMTRLHDGQRVEVDGTAGVVRILSAAPGAGETPPPDVRGILDPSAPIRPR